jgi:hypothetical protein
MPRIDRELDVAREEMKKGHELAETRADVGSRAVAY